MSDKDWRVHQINTPRGVRFAAQEQTRKGEWETLRTELEYSVAEDWMLDFISFKLAKAKEADGEGK